MKNTNKYYLECDIYPDAMGFFFCNPNAWISFKIDKIYDVDNPNLIVTCEVYFESPLKFEAIKKRIKRFDKDSYTMYKTLKPINE